VLKTESKINVKFSDNNRTASPVAAGIGREIYLPLEQRRCISMWFLSFDEQSPKIVQKIYRRK